MARGSKKEVSAAAELEIEERARLKQLAFSTNVLSNKPLKLGPSVALAPSKTVVKHHGKDILRKSQRKNRYLFSFPGLLGPISGGKIGDLKDLGTKNPILYLDFPQGRMKLFGTIVYPKNRYLTLQFSKGGKNVTCEDYFDNMIVFADAWWIGKKEDNPEEIELQFPKELNMENNEGYDFKGGVGTVNDGKKGLGRLAMKCAELVSPNVHLEDHSTDSPSDSKELVEGTPARQSARTAGKTFNFAEASSGDDFILDGEETSEEDGKVDTETRRHGQHKNSSPAAFEVDNKENDEQHQASGQYDLIGKVKDPSADAPTSLVQTTLSSLFKKVEEKKAKEVSKTGTYEVSMHLTQEKKIRERESVYGRKSSKASSTTHKKKKHGNLVPMTQSSPDLEDSIQDMDDSDEDWTA